jgi:beta-glucosidase
MPHATKELKGFKRVSLKPGESRKVTFTLHTSQLGIYDDEMRYVVQPGEVEVMVGNSSQNLPLTGSFEITGNPTEIRDGKVFFSDIDLE